MANEKTKTESYELMGGINSKISQYLNGPMEFRALSNLNFATPGALSKRPGTSLYIGATVSGRLTGGVEFQRLNGSSYIIVTANTNAYSVAGSYSAFKTGLLNNALFDFTTYVDRLFAANGQDFFKYDGSNSTAYSLPQGASGWGVTAVIGNAPNGMTGTFVASYGYLNDRGYYGPTAAGITITLNGITFGAIGYYGMTAPTGFGITAIVLYNTTRNGVDLTGTTFLPSTGSTATDTGFALTTLLGNDNLYFTLAPRYMEIYNNQLFMAGFSSIPSTVYWSQVGEPEGVDPEFSAEFRTNDGDRVTGMKAYNGALVVTKERSFHRVTGDNPTNFLFQEVSDQYGCLSNRAMVVFENLLWFLDPKGIVEYNGANTRVISNKVEDFFVNMNVDAARDNACALHVRQFNEVWFAIPCNGATYNNCVIVYDYIVHAWTKYDGVDISTLFSARGSRSEQSVFFGGYTGNLFYFDKNLKNDNGRAITCMIDPPFVAPRGQTVESQYRRYYLNLDPVAGVTQPITVNFRTNFGTSVMLSRTMYQAPFQSRVDFGLPARSIQAEVFHVSASLPFTVFGYAFESRFQRAT